MKGILSLFRAAKPCYMRFLSARLKSYQGFTLIEIMVVMVILGILAGLIVPRIMSRPEEARRTKAALQIRSIESALKLYKLDNGIYPSTEQGLDALVKKPESGNAPKRWREGGYLESAKVPKDPWGNPFVYLMPGEHGDFDLSAYGRDGQKGGEGDDQDINNWELE
jgi:general secretion pathway protein G